MVGHLIISLTQFRAVWSYLKTVLRLISCSVDRPVWVNTLNKESCRKSRLSILKYGHQHHNICPQNTYIHTTYLLSSILVRAAGPFSSPKYTISCPGTSIPIAPFVILPFITYVITHVIVHVTRCLRACLKVYMGAGLASTWGRMVGIDCQHKL